MDSYTAVLMQVAEQHQDYLTPAPLWLKNSNAAAARHMGAEDATPQHNLAGSCEPPPRLPPKSSLRSPSSFAQLERVVEETEETVPAPAIPREPVFEEHSHRGKLSRKLRPAAHALATKLSPSHSNGEPRTKHTPEQRVQQHEPMTEALDGMIAGLKSPQYDFKPPHEDPSHHNCRMEDHLGLPHSSQPAKIDRTSPSKRYETTNDGVPIQMKQRSGVRVEAVEGAHLASVQDQQRNIPEGQSITEPEAEDIREIMIPDDPRNNFPTSIKLEHGTADSSSPLQLLDTSSQGKNATTSWAQNQADICLQPRSRRLTKRAPTSDARSHQQITPWENPQAQALRPRRGTVESQLNEAPFYYENGRIRPNGNHLSNSPAGGLNLYGESSSSNAPSHKPASSNSSPNTSLTARTSHSPPPRNPLRIAATAQLDMQERIAKSASAVEQAIYGFLPEDGRGRSSRLEGVKLS